MLMKHTDPSQEPGRSILPSYEEVSQAYADIVAHNLEHTGFGAVFMAMIKATVESDDFIDPDDESENTIETDEKMGQRIAENLQQAVIEGDMDGDVQSIIHDDTFMRIGVKLRPAGSVISTLSGEKASSAAIEPEIENVTIFNEFLGTVEPKDVLIGDDQLLPRLLRNLRDRIYDCYSPYSVDKVPEYQRPALESAGEDALRTFLAIDPELQRLGLDATSLHNRFSVKPEGKGYLWVGENTPEDKKAEKAAHDEYNSAHRTAVTYTYLESYVTYWGRGLLPEYLDAGHYLLAPDEQGFGPAHWHEDGGQRHWRHALESVARLTGNERTRSFGEEVREGLIVSVNAAIEDLATPEKANWPSSIAENLRNIRSMLQGEEYDAQRILDYIDQ